MHRSIVRLSRPTTCRSLVARQWPGTPFLGATASARLQDQASRYKSLAVSAAYDQSIETFPSIVIGPNGTIIPQGSFAEAQAEVRIHGTR
jgi:hypothetical protein